jgi:hypothetical protein
MNQPVRPPRQPHVIVADIPPQLVKHKEHVTL